MTTVSNSFSQSESKSTAAFVNETTTPTVNKLQQQQSSSYDTHNLTMTDEDPSYNDEASMCSIAQSSSAGSSVSSVGDDDDDDSVGSSSTRNSNSRTDAGSMADGASSAQDMSIAKRETQAVNRAKLLMYLVLVVAATVSGLMTYLLTRDQNKKTAETEFAAVANELVDVAIRRTQTKTTAARGIAGTTTSYALDKNASFPFVTIPDYEFRTTFLRETSGTEAITLIPLVNNEEGSPQLLQWEAYAQRNQGWIREGLDYQGLEDVQPGRVPFRVNDLLFEGMTPKVDGDEHHDEDEDEHHDEDEGEDDEHHGALEEAVRLFIEASVAPTWQMGPAPIDAGIINLDLLSQPVFQQMAQDVILDNRGLLSPFVSFDLFLAFIHQDPNAEKFHPALRRHLIRQMAEIDEDDDKKDPRSFVLQPVFDTLQTGANVVAFYMVILPWKHFFDSILTNDKPLVNLVLSDSCGSQYTYDIRGSAGSIIGTGDLHDPEYDYVAVRGTYSSYSSGEQKAEHDRHNHCEYVFEAYATDAFFATYESQKPVYYALGVAGIFLFTAAIFFVYDWAVSRRQNEVMRTAKRTQAIVSSLFPKNVQDRIFEDAANDAIVGSGQRQKNGEKRTTRKEELANFLRGGNGEYDPKSVTKKSRPIADLFPEATVFFADIVGFTAWSSTREPQQVFLLLETIYQEFDQIATRRRIFKVETVGDCYVAVAGLPEPRKDHAMAMARFARDCLHKFGILVRQLVVELGPDTEELGLRVGMHSGPVTAGVLRGERARFQLFGDTVNTAARMESTGVPNKIQLSQETADHLISAGKSQWLSAREDKVLAKGKGEMSTFWLETSAGSSGARSTSSAASGSDKQESSYSANPAAVSEVPNQRAMQQLNNKHMRLVDWNVDIMTKVLSQVVTRRKAFAVQPDTPDDLRRTEQDVANTRLSLAEVKEIVALPKYTSAVQAVEEMQLNEEVVIQLHSYVEAVAAMYRQNPFHNFEHASHVTMSVLKLLGRIVAPDLNNAADDEALHDHTYGITSDPLTQFAVLLSALIHDVDHPGVPNAQLIKEGTRMAAVYNNKSVAEQNSVDLAWDLLMEDDYADLRGAIYCTEADFKRFRQLIVNIVLATDIMDKDLGALRKARWNKAFSEEPLAESEGDSVNRKATIVMEHLIQASDVAHTMQHWHIYCKWNQRLFREMYKAYREGRAAGDPSENWYKGEIGFFDFYIIPLAKKLKDCGVFGVSSDEYLQYAQQNRKEWELKGQEIVATLVETVTAEYESQLKQQPEQAM